MTVPAARRRSSLLTPKKSENIAGSESRTGHATCRGRAFRMLSLLCG